MSKIKRCPHCKKLIDSYKVEVGFYKCPECDSLIKTVKFLQRGERKKRKE